MDQIKIGEFIAKLRKSKNMTQQDLADKLNVTDRAVSNWENGRRMPDVSLFKPLCETLGITVNELINGEKISHKKIKSKSEEILIKTLKKQKKVKKKSNKIIISLLIISLCLIIVIFFISRGNSNLYPKIDLFNFTIQQSDSDKPYILEHQLKDNDRNVFYYGLDFAVFCEKNERCYQVNTALKNNQITLEEFQQYLNKQVEYENYEIINFWDGGTRVYYKGGMQIMFCNTTDGNKDVYIGNDKMIDNLNGEYCGHTKNETESYIRTYKILSSKISKEDDEFNLVELEQNDGTKGTVLINKSYSLIPGHIYEFSFYTFDYFDDTIENIFKYSTLIKAEETDKLEYEYINEDIYVNQLTTTKVDLNELEHVEITIKEGTLTNIGATIVIRDFSGHKYSYGEPYIIQEKIDGKWQEVESICDNCAFNSMAYGVDLNGTLELTCNWKLMYGKLDRGYYRIVKDAFINTERPITEEDIKYFSVEFEIK